MSRSATSVLTSAVLLLALAFSSGCAHAFLNRPQSSTDPNQGYRLQADDIGQQSDTLVALYFSGGGMRASALSYGVLKELSETRLPDGSNMLSRVTIINAVSGGSFTAAYYCLFGDRIFVDFEKLYLKRKMQSLLYDRVFTPFRNLRLASPYYARSDEAARTYDKVLFHDATFGDLQKRGRAAPFLVINATDMRTGGAVQFTQEQFDLWGSDISSYPISRAVAASSAVPVLLSPIVIKNYASAAHQLPKHYLNPEPGDAFLESVRATITARDRSYQDQSQTPYIYLVDGGMADNLGIQSLLDYVVLQGGWGNLTRQLHKAGVKRMVLIVVNAAKAFDEKPLIDDRTPTARLVMKALTTALIDSSNREVLDTLRAGLTLWRAQEQAQGLHTVDIHLVNVDFQSLSDPAERSFFLSIPTRFQLPEETIDRLIAKGRILLSEAPEYKSLVQELSTEISAAKASH